MVRRSSFDRRRVSLLDLIVVLEASLASLATILVRDKFLLITVRATVFLGLRHRLLDDFRLVVHRRTVASNFLAEQDHALDQANDSLVRIRPEALNVWQLLADLNESVADLLLD